MAFLIHAPSHIAAAANIAGFPPSDFQDRMTHRTLALEPRASPCTSASQSPRTPTARPTAPPRASSALSGTWRSSTASKTGPCRPGRRLRLVSRTPACAEQRPRGPRPMLVPPRSARSDLARLADGEACRACRHPRTGVSQGASWNRRLRGRLPGRSHAVADEVRAVSA